MKNQITEQTNVPDTRKHRIELIELYEELDYQTDECTDTRKEGIELIGLYEELDYRTDGCTRHT